ncbi:MAG: hypothetical protein ACRD3O_23595, partial [Terriglobia bacterium]
WTCPYSTERTTDGLPEENCQLTKHPRHGTIPLPPRIRGRIGVKTHWNGFRLPTTKAVQAT